MIIQNYNITIIICIGPSVHTAPITPVKTNTFYVVNNRKNVVLVNIFFFKRRDLKVKEYKMLNIQICNSINKLQYKRNYYKKIVESKFKIMKHEIYKPCLYKLRYTLLSYFFLENL